MATTFSGSGTWSTAGNWSAGVPVDGSDAIIAAGAVCSFNVSQSAFPNGLNSLVITGTLNMATDGTVTHLKMKGNITGVGIWNIGTPLVPIPVTSNSTPEVCTIAMNGAFSNNMSTAAAHNAYGEQREPYYAIASKTNNTTIVLAGTGSLTWLRAGDQIAISDSTIQGNHTPVTELFTVDSYTAATRTITLNAGTPLTRLVNQNGCTDLRSIKEP